MKRDIYEAITERFIEQLKRGTVPWQKPWFAVQNIVSRKPYRGINALLLGSTDYQSPFWISFKQALDLGGHVKKGEKSTPVIYYKILEKRDEAGNMVVREDGRPARIPFVRWANVFNLDQTEGIPAPEITASQNVTQPHEKAAAIVENAKLCPIHHGGFAALYSRKDDVIRIPAPTTFTARRTISAWPLAQKKTRRTQRHQRVPRAAGTPDRIPLLRKTHYRNSGRRVSPPFSRA